MPVAGKAHELEVIARECEGGSGYPPLLFVHGSCHGAWCWDEHFLGFFADHGYDSYALSLRGHGKSGGGERLRWTSVADYVADVERVAAGLPRPPVVIGHSLGGFVVQKYLERHEAPGAVLVAPAPRRGMRRAAVRMSLRAPWLSLKLFLTLEPLTMFSTPELCRSLLFSPATSEEIVQRCAAQVGRESFRSWLEMLGTPPDIARIRGAPMLVLAAARDALIPEPALRRTAEAYEADLTMLPDMGHDLMLDDGWRGAAEAMLEWLPGALATAPFEGRP